MHSSGSEGPGCTSTFYLDRSRGPFGTLIGHVARANAVWRELGPATPSVMMFQGPQAYITPSWYLGTAEHIAFESTSCI